MPQIKDLGSEKTVPSNSDLLPIQEIDGTTRRITRKNFLTGITSGGESTLKYIQLLDKRASGTNGGTPVTNSWQNKAINTIATDQTSLVTLSSNTFILPPGDYWLDSKVSFYRPYEVKLRLFNITDNLLILTGLNNYVGNVDTSLNVSLSGYFSIVASISLGIQYRCNNAIGNIGLGASNNFGDEIYLIADIFKL